MSLENYISLQGPLAETFPKLVPETILHADELTNLRRTHPDEQKRKELRNQWFYTADGPIYTDEDNSCQHCKNQADEQILHLTRGEGNLIFKNIDEATTQLINDKNYTPNKEDLEAAIHSESTLRIVLNKLRLKEYEHNAEFSYIEFDPANPDLNEEEEKLVQRPFGQGTDFPKNMEMFSEDGIKKIRAYVLTPKYVKKTIRQKNVPALARAGWLDDFAGDSNFSASDRNVDVAYGRLHGVPRSPQARAGNSNAQNGGMYRNSDAGNPNLEITLTTVFEASQDYVPSAVRETYEAKLREALGKIF